MMDGWMDGWMDTTTILSDKLLLTSYVSHLLLEKQCVVVWQRYFVGLLASLRFSESYVLARFDSKIHFTTDEFTCQWTLVGPGCRNSGWTNHQTIRISRDWIVYVWKQESFSSSKVVLWEFPIMSSLQQTSPPPPIHV